MSSETPADESGHAEPEGDPPADTEANEPKEAEFPPIEPGADDDPAPAAEESPGDTPV